jgi:hypothetical protein
MNQIKCQKCQKHLVGVIQCRECPPRAWWNGGYCIWVVSVIASTSHTHEHTLTPDKKCAWTLPEVSCQWWDFRFQSFSSPAFPVFHIVTTCYFQSFTHHYRIFWILLLKTQMLCAKKLSYIWIFAQSRMLLYPDGVEQSLDIIPT